MMGLKWTGIAAAAIAAVLAAAPAEAQKSNDTLRFAFQRDTKALDSILDAGIHTAFTQPAVFDTLMTYNERTQSFEPGLAKSWTRVSSTVTEFRTARRCEMARRPTFRRGRRGLYAWLGH